MKLPTRGLLTVFAFVAFTEMSLLGLFTSPLV